MTTRLEFLAGLSVLALSACGEDGGAGSSEQLVATEWSAGDLDPYGCPFLVPTPWVSQEQHQDECGPGCTPNAIAEKTTDIFVGCVGEDVPQLDSETLIPSSIVCLTNPLDKQDYRFGDISGAWPMLHLCWAYCGEDTPPLPSPDAMPPFEPPSECFVQP